MYISLLFFGLFFINIILAWGLVWSRQDTWMRHMALPYTVFILPLYLLVLLEVLGHHKPSVIAWSELGGKHAKVIAYKPVPNEAIYVYLDIGQAEPRAISLPWSPAMVRKLSRIMEAEGQSGTAMITGTDTWVIESDVAREAPQPPNPPKIY